MKKLFTKNELINFIFILFGTLCISLSVVLFFTSNNITTGGTPGMAILLHHISSFSISSMIIAINVPLLLWGYKYLGKMFAIRTIIAIVLISFFIDFFINTLELSVLSQNIMLSSIFGGLIIGFGVGFIIKGNASAGGSTIIARILSSSRIKASQVILFIDLIIILFSIYVFEDLEKAMFSILSIYITSKAIDVVLTGTLSTKVIHIVSNKPKLLSSCIKNELGVEGTILAGVSFEKQENKTLLFIVLDVKEITKLRHIVSSNDKEAFLIVMEASEMLGRGH